MHACEPGEAHGAHEAHERREHSRAIIRPPCPAGVRAPGLLRAITTETVCNP